MRIITASIGIFVAVGALAAEPEIIDPDASFPEGPAVVDGTLYYAEYGAHRISTWDGSTVSTFWEQEGCGPSAVQRFGDGFLVTCYDNGTLALVSADGSSATAISADDQGNPLVGPNDIVLDGRGGAYVTTSGPWESGPIVGKILHVTADGVASVVADDLHYPNGLALSAEGSTLFVNESEASRVIRFTVAGDFSLSDRHLFVRLTYLDEPAGGYPDGIKLGPDGRLYIGLLSDGRIIVTNSAGELVTKYNVPSTSAPNRTFSEDGKTMYVMAVDEPYEAPYPGKVFAITLEE